MDKETAPQEGSEFPGTNEVGGLEGESGPSTALVQITDELAVFYGDHVPDGAKLIPFTLIDEPTRASVSVAIAGAAGFGNVAAQGVNGVMQAQGLVRLAPQTLAQLKTATPIVKDGWNLGTLASEGKFVAQVRWLPAGGATAASVVASVGPALALMAIQVQLNQITELAKHNVELTSEVLRKLRQSDWSEVTGYHNTLLKELGNAREIGMVTDSIYQEIRGYQAILATQWDYYERTVQSRAKELRRKQGHKERQQYLTDNGEAIIADVQALLLTQTSWFIYQAMRAGHLLNSAEVSPTDEALLKKLVADARELHDKTLDETDWLLEEIAREFAVIGELPGKRTIKFGGSARAAKDAAHMVRRLQAALAAIRGERSSEEPHILGRPPIQVFERDVPEDLSRILPLRLQRGERVLALADASCDRWDLHVRDAGWVAVTNRRVLITKQDTLRRQGALDIALDLDDIRYVRRPGSSDKSLAMDIITKDTSLTLKFDSWAKNGAHRTEVIEFGELVASFMHLPVSEVPTVHLAELLDSSGDQGMLTAGDTTDTLDKMSGPSSP